jgi:DNA-binding CsgD family transcriptional regulator
MRPMVAELGALGHGHARNINGLDPAGPGAFIGMWARTQPEPPPAEMTIYRRMAHHLGAAHRCRLRLRKSEGHGRSVDATDGAEAILDARRRIVHAEGLARGKASQSDLVETAKARDQARLRKGDADEALRRWPPLTRARWTLVDRFERNGAKYIVARENQSQVRGLASLSDRERQVAAYLAIGQSTKETAYALGISDATVRVLLARAASKLGVRTRADLLGHAEVRLLCPPPCNEPAGPTAPSISATPGKRKA